MSQAHDQARTAPAKQVRLKAGEEVTEIAVTKVRYQQIATNGRGLGKVISGYADVAAMAERTGRSHVIAYRISPDGQAELIPPPSVEAPVDPLDAALARARARGQVKAAEILKGEDMLTARDFGPLIGASHETVNTKRKRHEILGLEGATRGVKYPRWQVTDAGLPLPGLPTLFEILGAQPWTIYRFLRTTHAELAGRTALDALKAGQVEAVVGVAENQAAGAFA